MPAWTEARLNGLRFIFKEDSIFLFHPFAGSAGKQSIDFQVLIAGILNLPASY